MGLVAGLVLVACGSDSPPPTSPPTEPTAASAPVQRVRDADAIRLAELAGHAMRRALKVLPDPVLPQIDINPNTGTHVFYFTNAASTTSFYVAAEDADTPPEEWRIVRVGLSPLTGLPRTSLDAESLTVGPATAVRISALPWPACETTLTLGGEGDGLTWTAFCNTANGGLVLGWVDGLTGEFTLSTAPPAQAAPTTLPATPAAIASIGSEVGAMAPDFTLPSVVGNDVSLASYRGESNVVLIFYRGAW
jgi:hypothetical protein